MQDKEIENFIIRIRVIETDDHINSKDYNFVIYLACIKSSEAKFAIFVNFPRDIGWIKIKLSVLS